MKHDVKAWMWFCQVCDYKTSDADKARKHRWGRGHDLKFLTVGL